MDTRFGDIRSMGFVGGLGFVRSLGFIRIDLRYRVKRSMGFIGSLGFLRGVGEFDPTRPNRGSVTGTLNAGAQMGAGECEAVGEKPALRLIAGQRYRLPVTFTGLFPLASTVKQTSLGGRQEVIVFQTARVLQRGE